MEHIVDQLIKIYYDEEYWHNKKLPHDEAVKYHMKMLRDGNIVYYEELGVVLGYYEVWRITFEQFGRLICKVPFSSYQENVKDGNIAYVANVWVDKKFRRGNVIRLLKFQFFNQNRHCEYFVGEALRKKTQPVKVFTRADLISDLFNKGAEYGQGQDNHSRQL